jgi:acid phosphatase
MRRLVVASGAVALLALALVSAQASRSATTVKADPGLGQLKKIQHIVVIYEENHSFDNLYGGWEGVNGRSSAGYAAALKQVNGSGAAFTCLKQLDVNLAAVTPQSCTDTTTAASFTSAFTNAPFQIDSYIPSSATTCPAQNVFGPTNGLLNGTGLPGGCTRDIVHRFYQEQFQIDHGQMDRYVLGSDAAGLTMGFYDTKSLPVYTYLHAKNHPDYAIADDFFQGAFGGSFLNHQWLVAAQAPVFTGALNDGSSGDLHSVLDANGFPNASYPFYAPVGGTKVVDAQLTQSCTPPAGRPAPVSGLACGDFAVNTTQPWYQPYSPGTPDARRLPPQNAPTIGDAMTRHKITWAWYSGGWDNADGITTGKGWTNGPGPTCSDPNHLSTAVYPNCPDGTFQFHHQAFNYFASFAPGTAQRTNDLLDEVDFTSAAQASTKSCQLRQVSFIKPLGVENEHPGYASESNGDSHLVDLLKDIEGSACAKSTMVIVTYDEFGGQWDHVPPPGVGSPTKGPHDAFGPGTRIPALILAPDLRGSYVVDHTEHDTTSIMTTIEQRFGIAALATRDAAVASLASAFAAKPYTK